MSVEWMELWPHFFGALSFVLAVACSSHAILKKRDSRAATGWVGLIWLVPIFGTVLYLLLGINRVRRVARELREHRPETAHQSKGVKISEEDFKLRFPNHTHFYPLTRLGFNFSGREFTVGNKIKFLSNGDEAYSRMLSAIENASQSVTLSTYIFDNDRIGRKFIEALNQARERGIQVRVLIDDIGLRYSWRPVLRQLKSARIPVARFMGALRPRTFPHFNLRKHRKTLITDGVLAFTGGMNIREGHAVELNPKHPIQDLQFELEGPIVTQLQDVFVDDWAYTTGEILAGPPWFSRTHIDGSSLARVISDGPDEDLNKISLVKEGAIACAKNSIWILTPYFLPDASLMTSLSVAAAKGIDVNIVLPEKNNLPYVQWASNTLLPYLIEQGCKVWLTPPPFDHSKLMLIDNAWAFFGSSNWDPRSLRLNFELNIECYDLGLGQSLKKWIDSKVSQAQLLSTSRLQSRSWIYHFRDGIARLFSPYL